jgi:hypothetical protein
MPNVMMTKKDLLSALEALGDDDLILVKCDGGDYWGYYLDSPVLKLVKSLHGMLDGSFIGHPGGHQNPTACADGAMVAILSAL